MLWFVVLVVRLTEGEGAHTDDLPNELQWERIDGSAAAGRGRAVDTKLVDTDAQLFQ